MLGVTFCDWPGDSTGSEIALKKWHFGGWGKRVIMLIERLLPLRCDPGSHSVIACCVSLVFNISFAPPPQDNSINLFDALDHVLLLRKTFVSNILGGVFVAPAEDKNERRNLGSSKN